MGRRSKQEQIVKAARSLFVERGYQGTSIELVVQRARVSKPTVYNHYPTKQAMLVDMLSELKPELEMLITQASGDAGRGDLIAAIKLFRALVASPDLVAAFRIRIGEAHKLEAEAVAAFDTLESLLLNWFVHWFGDVNAARYHAILYSGVLFPALLGRSAVTDEELLRRLSQ